MSYLVPEGLELEGLLHDSTEAYLVISYDLSRESCPCIRISRILCMLE